MGPTRFPYGQALGFQNQFNFTVGPSVSGTAGLISGSTAPNVTIGNLFYTNNTDALTITNFLLDDTANRLTQYEGKVIRVMFLDTATRIDNAGPLFLAGTDNLMVGTITNGFSWIELMFSRGNWYETSRARISRSEVPTVTMTNASSYTVDGVNVLILNNTGSVTRPISAFSGGQVGQIVTLLRASSNPFLIQTGGNLVFVGTNAFVINASGAYQFVKRDNSLWNLIYQSTAGGII